MQRYEFADGSISTVAGSGDKAVLDGVGIAAKFQNPEMIAIDPVASAYALVTDSSVIRKIDLTSYQVTTVVGSASDATQVDGNSNVARFISARGIAIDPIDGAYALVAQYNYPHARVRRINLNDFSVTTLAGGGTTTEDGPGVDGTGSSAVFHQCVGIAIDPTGTFALVNSRHYAGYQT